MPAKTKYLSSGWTRFSKVTVAVLGSYMLTMMLHIALIKLAPDDRPVVLTSAYTSFLLWVGFMVLAFFIKKVWYVWSIYLGGALLCGLVIFLAS